MVFAVSDPGDIVVLAMYARISNVFNLYDGDRTIFCKFIGGKNDTLVRCTCEGSQLYAYDALYIMLIARQRERSGVRTAFVPLSVPFFQ